LPLQTLFVQSGVRAVGPKAIFKWMESPLVAVYSLKWTVPRSCAFAPEKCRKLVQL
jgi:hypothetical protein